MAVNGNGTYRWIAGGLAIALSGVVVWAADGVKDTINDYRSEQVVTKAKVDSLANVQVGYDINQAKQTLQLAAMSKAMGVPVIMDTAKAAEVVAEDTIHQ